jgi:hypothetical protein
MEGSMRFLAILVLFSFNAFAVDWSELEIAQNYKLKQSFGLPQTERSGSIQDFLVGDDLVLTDIVPLDMINVIIYEFDYKKCPGPAMKTDMEIIPVHGSSPVVEIGAQLENCTLSIYIETKDISSQSFIE